MPRGHYPRQAKRAAAEEAPPAVVMHSPVVVASNDPLQPGRRVQDMAEAELRAYALQVGMSTSDARDLKVERLREGCLHHLYQLIDEI